MNEGTETPRRGLTAPAPADVEPGEPYRRENADLRSILRAVRAMVDVGIDSTDFIGNPEELHPDLVSECDWHRDVRVERDTLLHTLIAIGDRADCTLASYGEASDAWLDSPTQTAVVDLRDGRNLAPVVDRLVGYVDRLAATVGTLADDVAASRQEVRTRRLVVVDEHGDERIVGGTLFDGTVTDLRLISAADRDTCVTLWTNDEDGPTGLGLTFWGDGNDVTGAGFDVRSDAVDPGPRRQWTVRS